jgi:hypothetical protein
MTRASRYILSIAAAIGLTSMVYFFGLILQLPFAIIVLLVFGACFFAIRWMNKERWVVTEERASRFAFFILLAGVYLITSKVYHFATKYGEWDAWAIWNLHAKYLADSNKWQQLFLNTAYAHVDYPLALPGNIAFFSRLAVDKSMLLVPFGFHFLVTLCIPILIFVALQKKSTVVSGLALLLLATDEFYLKEGISQYADTLLAFFFLCAFIAVNHQEERKSVVLTGFMLGCCLWTKNEGVILAAVFTIFYLPLLLKARLLKYFAAGILIPLIVWTIFKLLYAPSNDVLAGQGDKTWDYIFQPERYELIRKFLWENLMLKFKTVVYAVVIYLALCAIFKRSPDKQLLIILTCLGLYMAIYVITPRDLEWHLFTSQHRLLHQLMPATVYVLARRLSGEANSRKITTNFSVLQRLR